MDKDELMTVGAFAKKMKLPYSKINFYIGQNIIQIKKRIGFYRMVDYNEAKKACQEKLKANEKIAQIRKKLKEAKGN